MDGLIITVVEILRFLRDCYFTVLRKTVKILTFLRSPSLMDGAKFSGFLVGILTPKSSNKVSCKSLFSKVKGYCCELQVRAALLPHDHKIIRNGGKFSQIFLCLSDNVLELLRSMRHFADADAFSLPAEEFFLYLLKNFLGKYCWAR